MKTFALLKSKALGIALAASFFLSALCSQAWTYTVGMDSQCDLYVEIEVYGSCNLFPATPYALITGTAYAISGGGNFSIPSGTVVRRVTFTGMSSGTISWNCSMGTVNWDYPNESCTDLNCPNPPYTSTGVNVQITGGGAKFTEMCY